MSQVVTLNLLNVVRNLCFFSFVLIYLFCKPCKKPCKQFSNLLRFSSQKKFHLRNEVIPKTSLHIAFAFAETCKITIYFMKMQMLYVNTTLVAMDSIHFFKKNFVEDISPFCGATDTPVLDF